MPACIDSRTIRRASAIGNRTTGQRSRSVRATPAGNGSAALGWPVLAGEIDFPEADLNGGTVSAFMHRQNGTSGSDQDHFGSAVTLKDWHTYALEWTPNRCEFLIDGKSIGKSTSRIPNTPMRFVAQNETELNSTYPARTAVARVYIDSFKAWKYTG